MSSMLVELFHELSDPWPEASLLVDRAGIILAANTAGARRLGLSRGEAAGHALAEFVMDGADQLAAYLATCAGNRQPIPGSLSFRDTSGEPVRHRCTGYRVRPDGQAAPVILLRCQPAHSAKDSFMALNRQLDEQRLAHRDLKTSHTRLKAVLDSLEALVYVADMQTYEILFINRYGIELFGDITGRTCWQTLQTGQDGPCSFCTNLQLLTPEGRPAEVCRWEFENTRTRRWYYIMDRAIPWNDGRVVRLEIATDITERKAAEARLKLNEERAEALWNLSQTPWDSRDSLVDHALEEAVRLTSSTVGYLHFFKEDQQTLEFFSWSRSVHEQCATAKLQHDPLEQAGIWADSVRLRQPVIHNDCQRMPGRKGYPEGHFPVQRHMSVPIFDDERIVAVAGVGNKETPYDQSDCRQLSLFMGSMWRLLKQRQVELEVKQAKEQWEQTFNATDLTVTIHDPEMRIMRANQAAGRLLGMEPAALVGRHCYELFHDGTSPCPGCPEVLTITNHTSQQGIIHHPKLGKVFEVSSSPRFDSQGVFLGSVHIAKDVTEHKAIEAKLRQAQKMEAIGTLAGGIAHDFNNILSPILGYAELTLGTVEADTPVATALTAICNAAIRARDLTRQILTFSRQTEYEKKALQPYPVINEALKLLRASLPTTIEIREDIATDCGMILGDPTQLHQIIMNLCTNAYHAMREQGGVLAVALKKVEIDARDRKVASLEMAAGPYVKLEVSDTGHGMDHQTVEKIFEPYFTTKRQGEGTGLGLALVHGIVKGYGGHVAVYSEPGLGTTFHVYLPRLAEELPPAEALAPETLPEGKQERLLVVDDEKAITAMLDTMLTRLGYRVTVCNSSEEALQLFQATPAGFDLLITDMTMPHLTGLDLAKQVFAIRPAMPLILCTGFSELINREKAVSLGIQAFLMKPFSVRDLAQAIRKVMVPG